MPSRFKFSDLDREDLERRGIAEAEAHRQLELLGSPPAPPNLLRPCRVGDGITTLPPERWEALEEAWRDSAPNLRLVKFVPASGAATRMFSFVGEARTRLGDADRSQLRQAARGGDRAAQRVLELLEHYGTLALAPALETLAAERSLDLGNLEQRPLALGALIAGGKGLSLANLPKALIPFHRYTSGVRSSFEEHLYEAALYVAGEGNVARVHLTVTPEHIALFEQAAQQIVPAAERRTKVEFEVRFSVQDSSTDTLAVAVASADEEGDQPLRSGEGRLTFRPSGHGALLSNLSRIKADVVFIKNVDNIAPEDRHHEAAAWKRRLGAHLLALRRESFELLDRLEVARFDAQAAEDAKLLSIATGFCQKNLALRFPASMVAGPPEALRRYLIDRLDRPLRVCGVVKNVGEPGGGPFWTADDTAPPSVRGVEAGQIVEAGQVDFDEASQAEIFAAATHFNPVDLACSWRDRTGTPYELARFTDPAASFIAEKKLRGRTIRVLERPGLWNGAMAGWNTAFVEVPLTTFTPVKTILDLARPEHQPKTANRN